MAQTPEQILAGTDSKISLYKRQIAAQNAAIKKIQDAKPAGKGAMASRKKDIENRKKTIANIQKQLDALTPVRAKQQNNVYAARGQYEKLLSGGQRDAFMGMQTLLKTYGLESLAPKIFGYAQENFTKDTVIPLLQNTEEWKKRFAGNEMLKKMGLEVLDAPAYLDAETKMEAIMRQAGLPKGFYDSREDFANFIGQNVSPIELKERVDAASQATILANPQYRKALNMMGIDNDHMTAYFLDPKRSMPLIQKQAATAAMAAEAMYQGMDADIGYAEHLATRGITNQEAQQGYKEIAMTQEAFSNLAKVSGTEWSQREAEQASIEGLGEAVNKRQKLLSQERGRFGGATGGGAGGMGVATRRNT